MDEESKIRFELFKIFLKGYYEHNLKNKHYGEDKVIKESIRNSKWAYEQYFENKDEPNINKISDIQNIKIGDKCFYMYYNKPNEGIIKDISFHKSTEDNNRIKYKVKAQHILEKDDRLGAYNIEVEEIFLTKKELLSHLDNLIEESINKNKRYKDGKNTQ